MGRAPEWRYVGLAIACVAALAWPLGGQFLAPEPLFPSPFDIALAAASPVGEQTLEVDGVVLEERQVGGRLLRVQRGVAEDRIGWAVEGWQLGATVLQARLGLSPPQDPVPLYLFADQDAFRRVTSALTGLPVGAIAAFEGGRSYASDARRGIYLQTETLTSAAQMARVVAHELTHLAERDLLGRGGLPLWFSEGLAEYVSQQAMAAVDAAAAARRRWRRAALVASAWHQGQWRPLAALTTEPQWREAVSGGAHWLAYAQALLATEWLVARAGEPALARVLAEMGRGATFEAALQAATGLSPAGLEAALSMDQRAQLLARYPVGVHVWPRAGPPGAQFQFAAVGLPAGEELTKQFVRDDGYHARSSGGPSIVDRFGAAFWTFQTRPESPRATWTLTVEGSQGTRATVTFYVELPLSDAAPQHP
jgi:hypothetical protein